MKKILVIEHTKDELILLKEILEDEQYTVLGTIVAETAYEMIRQGVQIDLIIINVSFETTGSFDTIKTIKTCCADCAIPLIALTTSSVKAENEKALAEGCVDIVTKPIDEALLVSCVKKYI
jgi:CheY-like chemotaxis protein